MGLNMLFPPSTPPHSPQKVLMKSCMVCRFGLSKDPPDPSSHTSHHPSIPSSPLSDQSTPPHNKLQDTVFPFTEVIILVEKLNLLVGEGVKNIQRGYLFNHFELLHAVKKSAPFCPTQRLQKKGLHAFIVVTQKISRQYKMNNFLISSVLHLFYFLYFQYLLR